MSYDGGVGVPPLPALESPQPHYLNCTAKPPQIIGPDGPKEYESDRIAVPRIAGQRQQTIQRLLRLVEAVKAHELEAHRETRKKCVLENAPNGTFSLPRYLSRVTSSDQQHQKTKNYRLRHHNSCLEGPLGHALTSVETIASTIDYNAIARSRSA